jgi:hypothetical protein
MIRDDRAPGPDELRRRDILDCMAACIGTDPGQDENPDPDDFPAGSDAK